MPYEKADDPFYDISHFSIEIIKLRDLIGHYFYQLGEREQWQTPWEVNGRDDFKMNNTKGWHSFFGMKVEGSPNHDNGLILNLPIKQVKPNVMANFLFAFRTNIHTRECEGESQIGWIIDIDQLVHEVFSNLCTIIQNAMETENGVACANYMAVIQNRGHNRTLGKLMFKVGSAVTHLIVEDPDDCEFPLHNVVTYEPV